MGRAAPRWAGQSRIESQAGRIQDPIARLRYLRGSHAPRQSSHSRWMACTFVALLASSQAADFAARRSTPLNPPPAPAVMAAAPTPSVWPIEETKDHEIFSNGLRVEDSLEVANEPRSYRLVDRSDPPASGPERTVPAGIVFPTTESDLAPLEPRETRTLQRIGRELLLYVRQKRSYHFVIDRFGGVHRIVRESDSANHAGHSAWADSKWLYAGLNESFLGVAFEAQTQVGYQIITEAQIHAARVLVEMLRDKYNIPAEDCVTHAQVSLNPAANLIGWHTDWADRFPFASLGLPDNYRLPSPLIDEFGFGYDAAYVKATGPDVWSGLRLADERVREAAARNGSSAAVYRRFLQTRYRELAGLHHAESPEEN